jgi:hypothetical protein
VIVLKKPFSLSLILSSFVSIQLQCNVIPFFERVKCEMEFASLEKKSVHAQIGDASAEKDRE